MFEQLVEACLLGESILWWVLERLDRLNVMCEGELAAYVLWPGMCPITLTSFTKRVERV